MTTTNGGAVDGGPAFPGEKSMRFGQTNDCNEGMTLRQWYAGLAMQGLVASGEYRSATAEWIAQEAVFIANAMLATRNPSHD